MDRFENWNLPQKKLKELVPKEWEVVSAGYIFDQQHRNVLDDDEIVTVFRDGEVTLRANRRTTGFTMAEKEIGYHHIEKGDLAIHKMDGGFGAIGISDSTGKVSPVIHLYRSNKADLRFANYVLHNAVNDGFIASQQKGVRIRSIEFDVQSFARFPFPLPPLSEQEIIADYLDEETAEIDATVAKLDELIEALGHHRASSIREAIQLAKEKAKTAGIDSLPDLGYKSIMIRRGISPHYTEDGFEDTDNGIRVLNQKCVRENSEIDYSHARRNNIEKKPVSNELLIQPGDILINSTGTGTLGRTALVRDVDEPTTVDSHVTIVRHNGTLEDRFLGYFMSFSEDVLVSESRGSTNQIELSQSTVARLELPFLPLDEQCHIADYLDEETARIDKLKSTATELRDELLARRKTIITEVVTGQKRLVN